MRIRDDISVGRLLFTSDQLDKVHEWQQEQIDDCQRNKEPQLNRPKVKQMIVLFAEKIKGLISLRPYPSAKEENANNIWEDNGDWEVVYHPPAQGRTIDATGEQ